LKRQGWDDRIVNLVANHSCACLEADERDLRANLENGEGSIYPHGNGYAA
jgi:hypothetical protein